MQSDSNHSSAKFSDLGLPHSILDRLDQLGFETPTAIQAETIPLLLEGRDVVGIAQTGTGKTAAFGLPLIARLDPDSRNVQALVLAPTRELALQITQALQSFSPKTNILTVYGGSSYGPQLKALREGVPVVVGTPGRIMDLMKRGSLDLSGISTLVIDEADEMLRMGFAEDVDTITQEASDDRLTALFSATMPPQIAKVAKKHLRNPKTVEVSSQSSTVDTITQQFAIISGRYRFEALKRVLAVHGEGAVIVFVKTRADAEEISLDLASTGLRVAGISGDVAQTDRERIVQRLRRGDLDVLVATDVAARGLDVERISLVVNYEVPREKEAYVHRIGRTGRAGREGVSLTFFTPKEQYRLRQIERLTGTKMQRVDIPTREEVLQHLAVQSLEKVTSKQIAAPIMAAAASVLEQHSAGADADPLAVRLLAGLIDQSGLVAQMEEDPAVSQARALVTDFDAQKGKKPRSEGDRRAKGSKRGTRPSFEYRYRVEVGHRDGVKPGSIVGAITAEGGVRGDQLGHIAIFPSFSVVEIAEPLNARQVKKIGKATVKGRRLRIAVDRKTAVSPKRKK